jgi:ACS family tartrate transporter-like MFS transporter
MAAAPISTALGSPVSGALLQMHGFLPARLAMDVLCEAIPAIILGVITFFYLTDTPPKPAGWLPTNANGWSRRWRPNAPPARQPRPATTRCVP